MFTWIFLGFRALLEGLISHQILVLENLSLRQQIAVLKRQVPKPKFRASDRLFWVLLSRLWS
ncbi:MAG: hypothetical protein AB1405_04950, partial [Bdellovibrionota bacterium]